MFISLYEQLFFLLAIPESLGFLKLGQSEFLDVGNVEWHQQLTIFRL